MGLKPINKTNSGASKKINPKQLLEEHRKAYVDAIQEELESKSVIFFTPEDDSLNIDRDYLSLPMNITDVSNKDLGEYLNAFTQQKLYVRTLLGWAETMLEEARIEYHKVADPHYRELSKSKMSEKAKDIEVNSSEDVIEAYKAVQDMKTKISLLNHSIENLTDALFMISREVSRRTSDFDNESRSNNVNSR